jgi:hypothetical protein
MSAKIYEPRDRVSRHYAQRARQVVSAFSDIRGLIDNQGAKGARVEREVRDFLLKFLPGRYEYTSGIVVDNSGGECDFSRQQDLLIVDRMFNAKLFLDEEPAVYPVDVVYCGVEVKTSLDGGEMRAAVENIASLKRLEYIRQRVTFTTSNALCVGRTTPPMGVIFAFEANTRNAETLLRQLSDAVGTYPRAHWPDLVCVLNRGIMGFVDDDRPAFALYGLLGQDANGQVAEVLCSAPGDFVDYEGCRYPTLCIEGKRYVVDVGRTYTGFLAELYRFLLSKHLIAQSNLLDEYVPEEMRRRRTFIHNQGTRPTGVDTPALDAEASRNGGAT